MDQLANSEVVGLMGQPTGYVGVMTGWTIGYEVWVIDAADSRCSADGWQMVHTFMFDHMKFGSPSTLATIHCFLYIIQFLPTILRLSAKYQ